MNKFFLYSVQIFLVLVFIVGCSSSQSSSLITKDNNLKKSETTTKEEYVSNYINIKYRNDAVDIGNSRFEYLNTSGSSFIRGAWYDDDNQYMVINLRGTYYHYCGLPKATWSSFKTVSSFGSYYNDNIYENYDCRVNYLPSY